MISFLYLEDLSKNLLVFELCFLICGFLIGRLGMDSYVFLFIFFENKYGKILKIKLLFSVVGNFVLRV